MLGRLVFLEAGRERVVLQLVGETLAQCLASPAKKEEGNLDYYLLLSNHILTDLWLSDSLR